MYPIVYIGSLQASAEFHHWLSELRDTQVRIRVLHRLKRLAKGHAGDQRMIDHRIRELRMHFGPGHRIYFAMRKGVPLLLLGGDKWSQFRDIDFARRILDQIEALP